MYVSVFISAPVGSGVPLLPVGGKVQYTHVEEDFGRLMWSSDCELALQRVEGST